jgi:hypothetical protein
VHPLELAQDINAGGRLRALLPSCYLYHVQSRRSNRPGHLLAEPLVARNCACWSQAIMANERAPAIGWTSDIALHAARSHTPEGAFAASASCRLLRGVLARFAASDKSRQLRQVPFDRRGVDRVRIEIRIVPFHHGLVVQMLRVGDGAQVGFVA